MKIYRIAKESPEYMLEKGLLYDENADDVFSIKELAKFKVPLFKNPTEANEFLASLESKTGRTFGRVPDRNLMKEIRYKDTRREKEQADMEFLNERNRKWQHGQF